MATSKSQKMASIKHAKEKLKRIPLDLKIEKYEIFKQFTDSKGMSMNGFIIKAMEEKMQRDSE